MHDHHDRPDSHAHKHALMGAEMKSWRLMWLVVIGLTVIAMYVICTIVLAVSPEKATGYDHKTHHTYLQDNQNRLHGGDVPEGG